MVYGQLLRLPRDYLIPSPALLLTDQRTTLRATFRARHPVLRHRLSNHPVFIVPHLSTSSHVFVWRTSIRPSLESPYGGYFKVLDHSSNDLTLGINNRFDVVAYEGENPTLFDTSLSLTPEHRLFIFQKRSRRITFTINVVSFMSDSQAPAYSKLKKRPLSNRTRLTEIPSPTLHAASTVRGFTSRISCGPPIKGSAVPTLYGERSVGPPCITQGVHELKKKYSE